MFNPNNGTEKNVEGGAQGGTTADVQVSDLRVFCFSFPLPPKNI